jgi:hypothetical protein
MIGVFANPSEHGAVREFFELFKTPWEFYRSDRQYKVLLCAGEGTISDKAAKLVLIYGGRKLSFDDQTELKAVPRQEYGRTLVYQQLRIPIYADSVHFLGRGASFLADADSRQPVGYLAQSDGRVVARIGYDLFREIDNLLTVGQPAHNADIPALELHIALLRDLIVSSGVELAEIPPVPEGYRFIACLTHDVDHPSIRRHRFDHTMFGFIFRAVLQSLFKLLMGRMSVREFLANWTAALKLPVVYLGLAKDFWLEFDRYPQLDGSPHSTFFVIPFKNYPGQIDGGTAHKHRASGYCATDIADQLHALRAAGCEIGLHGIDAWCDSAKGREELEQIRRITGMPDIGVRMHWLYFDRRSPLALERAGADYDTTVGYNEEIGYRAGTTQVYKPLEVSRLLELPLHIMDTALFYSTRLALSPKEARKRVGVIIDTVVRYGGAVTINWHDRSIAPERCWGDFYMGLVDELRSKGAWFATAAETVAWFRKRRSATFNVTCESAEVAVTVVGDASEDLPDLQLRIHRRDISHRTTMVGSGIPGTSSSQSERCTETPIALA